jgi:hypothetical protein
METFLDTWKDNGLNINAENQELLTNLLKIFQSQKEF